VQIPTVEAFTSVDAYRAVLLHECGHATGHKTRLARDFSGRFGDEAYAFEELVAELTSAMSQAVLGLRADVEMHASYLASWQRILTKDKHAFAKACSLAQRAADHLVGEQEEQHDEGETEATVQQAA
jgi:antirestriction protein ArdC